jgi:ABC-type multidrug transport system ATPase subunit
MSVLATIHQPSSDLLYCFDRVILLSEGFTVYNGSPGEIRSFFKPYGLVM